MDESTSNLPQGDITGQIVMGRYKKYVHIRSLPIQNCSYSRTRCFNTPKNYIQAMKLLKCALNQTH